MTTIFPGHISLRFLKMSLFDTNVCEVVALSFLVDSAKDSSWFTRTQDVLLTQQSLLFTPLKWHKGRTALTYDLGDRLMLYNTQS